MERTLISELPGRLDEQVQVRGWVNALRDQKSVQFVILRDETGLAQAVLRKDEPAERAERVDLRPDRRVGRDRDRHGRRRRACEARRPRAADRVGAGRLARRAGAADRARLGARQADRLALPRPAPARPQTDLRGADPRRAGDARVLARGGLHRAALAEADGLGERVRRRAVPRRLLRAPTPTSRSRRSSTSRWRWRPASARSSRSGRCSAPTLRSPRATTPSSRASTWSCPGSIRTRT